MPDKEGIRNYKRIPVKIEARITSDKSTYSGFIENVAVSGLNFTTFTSECITLFIPGTVFEITFQPSDEKIIMSGEIKRIEINKQPPRDLIYTIAFGITDPPNGYWKLLKSLK